MTGRSTSENRGSGDDDIVQRIRSVPRYKPSLAFRMRVALVATFGSLEFSHSRRRGTSHGWGPRFELSGHGRLVAAGAMCLVLAFLVFSCLVLVSGSSLPGQPLYGLKRAREKLSLAMTWGSAGKAERHLALASNRLSELDKIAAKGAVDPDDVESIARDYNSDASAVTKILAMDPGSPGAKGIARELQALQTQKANMVRRLSAESPSGVLASAVGAQVTLIDPDSSGVLGASGRVSGTTDSRGEMRVDLNVQNPSQLAMLDAVVEKDGRKGVVPVFAEATGNEDFKVEVTPQVKAAVVNRPVSFTLRVSHEDGSSIGQRRIKLSDSSQTSLIDGQRSEALLWTDRNGSCVFSFLKTSGSEVSRISLQVEEGGWVDAGQVMAIGAVEVPDTSSASGAVTASCFGSSANPQSVELNNRVVRVSARKSTDGEVIRSLVPASGTPEAGPLYDPIVLESKAIGGTVSVDGPRILMSTDTTAAFEVTFTLTVNGGSIRKTHRVALSADDCFASVKCTVTVSGTALELARAHPSLLATGVLKRPAGASLEVSGRKVDANQDRDKASVFSFQVGNPFIAFNTGTGIVFEAYPIDSGCFPDAWSVSSDSVSPTTGSSVAATGGYSTMLILGITDTEGFDSVIARARKGIGDPAIDNRATASGQTAEGFTVIAVPGMDKLARGKHTLTLKVLKQYEQVFQEFQ